MAEECCPLPMSLLFATWQAVAAAVHTDSPLLFTVQVDVVVAVYVCLVGRKSVQVRKGCYL